MKTAGPKEEKQWKLLKEENEASVKNIVDFAQRWVDAMEHATEVEKLNLKDSIWPALEKAYDPSNYTFGMIESASRIISDLWWRGHRFRKAYAMVRAEKNAEMANEQQPVLLDEDELFRE